MSVYFGGCYSGHGLSEWGKPWAFDGVTGGAAAIPRKASLTGAAQAGKHCCEMGEAPFRSGHYHALYATGIILFFVTLLFNMIADYVSQRFKQVGSATL
jgi:phosphate transport system permease protein